MFTGLITDVGEVVTLEKGTVGARLALRTARLAPDAGIGDSIAINGTCLTVVEIQGPVLAFELSLETLRSTNLGELRKKDRVNLEPSLRADARLGGHFVTGHIDGVGKIRSKTVAGDAWRIVISTGETIAGSLVEKGSVAVDGISLTVVDVLRDGFSIVIIPHTAKVTTIGMKGAGDSVNIEVDILGKYVRKFLGRGSDAHFMQTLEREGFA